MATQKHHLIDTSLSQTLVTKVPTLLKGFFLERERERERSTGDFWPNKWISLMIRIQQMPNDLEPWPCYSAPHWDIPVERTTSPSY